MDLSRSAVSPSSLTSITDGVPQALGWQTPDEAYFGTIAPVAAAAA
jgi:hypothetical protein